MERWTREDITKVQNFGRFLDLIISVSLVLVVFAIISLVTYEQPYSCFDSTVRPGYGQYIEVTGCEWNGQQYQCDQGIYNYCHEGGQP